MQRKICFILAFVFIISVLAGCRERRDYPTDNAYHPETDYQYSMSMEDNNLSITESGSGFYFYLPTCLFYLDMDAINPIAVCNKPECLHYDEPLRSDYQACNAYFSAGVRPTLFWYAGYVYIITEEKPGQQALVRIAPDGTERETLYRFETGTTIETAIVHRGVLYVAKRQSFQDGTSEGGIWAYSITDLSKKPVCIIPLTCRYGFNMQQYLTAYGQKLYFTRYTSDDGQRELCIYDLVSQEITCIPTDEDGYSPLYVTFSDGIMLLKSKSYIPQGDPDTFEAYPERVYRCRLDGSERTLLWEDMYYYTADEQYVYRRYFSTENKKENWQIEICRQDGTQVETIDLSEIGNVTDASFHVSAGNRVLIETTLNSGGEFRQRLYWFDKGEIGTEAITIHPFFDFTFFEYANVGQ